jgi:hypothetical protein
MTTDAAKLLELLPALYRLRDAEEGGPLRALLSVLADQIAVLEEDLDRLYDDQFIETCADWVVPYLGDLIGYRSLHHQVPRLASPRAEVAHTIAYRRRKGTASMLEQVARDVTGWPARVVEFFQLLAVSQFMNHVRPGCTTPDLRKWEPLERLETPFDSLAHTADARRIALGDGRHNLPNIGIFLWRLAACPLTRSPAFRVDDHRFTFSPLGHDAPLFHRPEREDAITHLAEPVNVPEPIGRRRADASLAAAKAAGRDACDFYGEGRSVFLPGVPLDDVRVCDLSDHAGSWAHTPPPPGTVAIDPVLGRVAFGDAQEEPPLVSFHHGFSADLGGGEYERADSFVLPRQPADPVASPGAIQAALDARTPGRAIQVEDSGRYEETLALATAPGERVELRAGNGHRPTLVLGGDFVLSGGDDATEVTLNGLLIAGGALRVTGPIGRVRLRHCTIVPGRALAPDGTPVDPDEPGLVVESPGVRVEIDRSITGAIRLHELSEAIVTGSIVDATDPARVAFAGPGAAPPGEPEPAGGALRVEETTVIGKVHARQVPLASNSIFLARLGEADPWPAPVLVDRRQAGCVRFSFVPESSRTPRRHRCQPDLEIETRADAAARELAASGQELTEAERAAIRARVVGWLKPAFTSTRYGEPAYAQLRRRSPVQIRQGADDEAAMGAFHDLFEPQRLANLRVRLGEYLRFGLEAGLFFVT